MVAPLSPPAQARRGSSRAAWVDSGKSDGPGRPHAGSTGSWSRTRRQSMEVTIVGGGIGGLTLALALHEQGTPCRVFEAAPEIRPLGVGINLLPHATSVLDGLGVLPALEPLA